MRYPFFAPEEVISGDLTIRMYRTADAEASREASLESYEHLKPWMPWASLDKTPDESELLMRRFMADYLTNVDFTLSVWRNGNFAGGTGFHLRGGAVETGVAEIGMWIRSSEAGRGLGTRVLEIMLAWGFQDWGWDRLIWKCDTRNIASARVAKKCGMTREATFRSDAIDTEGNRRDTHQYVILREEWLKVHNKT